MPRNAAPSFLWSGWPVGPVKCYFQTLLFHTRFHIEEHWTTTPRRPASLFEAVAVPAWTKMVETCVGLDLKPCKRYDRLGNVSESKSIDSVSEDLSTFLCRNSKLGQVVNTACCTSPPPVSRMALLLNRWGAHLNHFLGYFPVPHAKPAILPLVELRRSLAPCFAALPAGGKGREREGAPTRDETPGPVLPPTR